MLGDRLNRRGLLVAGDVVTDVWLCTRYRIIMAVEPTRTTGSVNGNSCQNGGGNQ
jgi:hypothetical protein